MTGDSSCLVKPWLLARCKGATAARPRFPAVRVLTVSACLEGSTLFAHRLSSAVPFWLVVVALLAAAWPAMAQESATQFVVTPASVSLSGNFAQAQLLLTADRSDGSTDKLSEDLTPRATYASSHPQVVTVNDAGRLLAVADGTATVTATVGGVSKSVEVKVAGVSATPAIGFNEYVIPILSKAGCSAGACHASQYGKGGFKLSVFGFAPDQDHAQIVRDRHGRRVDFLDPSQSLLLLKPTLAVPHGGGQRLQAGSVDVQTLAAWLAGGAPGPNSKAPKVSGITVLPRERVGPLGYGQQLQVVASYNDGTQRDVTCWAKFDSMDDAVVKVTPQGHYTTIGKGQAPVMVRFEGQADISMALVPYAKDVTLAGWTDNNFVDKLAAEKFRELGIEPSPLCDDATFVRRAYLDAIGTLPTIEEAAAFADATDPDKRRKLIDRLLGLTGDPALDVFNNEYAAFWSLKWSDLIRSTSTKLGEQGMWAMHNWIVDSLRQNKPFDKFVSELISAKGSIYMSGPANYYRIAAGPNELAEATAQLFLGVRLQCAQCHHHPFEKYSQDDYYGFAAFFSRVGTKNSQEFGLFGRESVVLVKPTGDVRHPRTGQVMPPTPLDGQAVDHELDRRLPLAAWLTAKDNTFFAKNVVNRYVAYLLGKGLVEPVDDMRATNPPSNVALMDALSQDFVASGFNLKHLLRTIMISRLYQLDSQPTASNKADSRYYSHYQVKRLGAEALLDAIDYVTGTQTKFKNMPLGTRAIELPDGEYPTYSLAVFGKPKRASTCECERVSDPSLVAALHIINSDTISVKLVDKSGRIGQLLAAKKPHDEIVSQLYLATLSRRPTAEEIKHSQQSLAESPGPQEFYEDLLWALMNTKAFMFNR
jgi:hypothetical protein